MGLSPNQWTFLSILMAIIAAYFIIKQNFPIASIFFAIAALCDIFDGAVARATGKATKMGAYIDTIIDRYVEFIVIVGLLFANLFPYILQSSFWLLLYLFGSIMTTYAKAAAKEKFSMTEEVKGGLLERSERMGLIFLGLVLASFSKIYLTYVIILVAILSNVTAIQRILIAKKLAKR